MSATEGSLVTPRLRLVPIGPGNAADLWLVHNDDEVVQWYDGWKPTPQEADEHAGRMGDSWRLHGVHKWIAYDRATDEVVGRGGLSRTPVDDDWGQIYAFLPDEPWVREAHESERPFTAHAHWLEIGWALRRKFWGHGYASEIGAAGLAFAFDVLGVRGRGVVHRPPQRSLACGDGAHRHAVCGRDPQPRDGRGTRGRARRRAVRGVRRVALTAASSQTRPQRSPESYPRSCSELACGAALRGVSEDRGHDGRPIGLVDAVAGSIERQQRGAGNLLGQRLAVREREHRVGRAVDHQRRRRDR